MAEVLGADPATRVETRLSRFAERVGKGPGTMFRITRRSVLAAAARVLSVGGKAVRAVTDTVLELADTERAARSALLKKLREAAVFVAE